jgi:hypothetical protein
LERGAISRTLFMEREREFVRETMVQGFKYRWTRLAGHFLGPLNIVQDCWSLSRWAGHCPTGILCPGGYGELEILQKSFELKIGLI